MILSVDLASRRYADIGIALMHGDRSASHVTLVDPARDLGLGGAPDVNVLADALLRIAGDHRVRLLLIDGPQGWRANESPYMHARQCERETRCPGKTGLPGIVLPKTWTSMAVFSVALFDRLHASGWPRLTGAWNGERAAIESFPTHAWRSLGHAALPGKGRKPDLTAWRMILQDAGVQTPLDGASHDELQAAVAGLAGLQLCADGLAACDERGALSGVAPRVEDGIWREGFILSPR